MNEHEYRTPEELVDDSLDLTPEQVADAMLFHAPLRIGGQVQMGTDEGMSYLIDWGYVSASGRLTPKGYARARALHDARWGER